MCVDCGCKEGNEKAYFDHHHGQLQRPNSQTTHEDGHPHQPRHITVNSSILEKNNHFANSNRAWLNQNKIETLNLIGSPGAGKTLLLEKTIQSLKNKINISILVGDQEQAFDADRLQKKGAKVKQLNTMSACHLDAHMIGHQLGHFVQPETDLLVIENVGNLVCPAAFDLGESQKIAVLSTTEGEDKPAKYPVLFHQAQAILITKTDLIPYLDWDIDKCKSFIHQVNPTAQIIEVSAKTEDGLGRWFDYLESFNH